MENDVYGKIFASLYQGTLRGRAHEILVFTNLIAHADREGVVDKHPRAIAEEVGLTVEQVRAALETLGQPDPESRSEAEEGRRLIPLDEHRNWGWVIVNYLKYRNLRDEEARRELNRKSQQKRRARIASGQHPSSPVITGHQMSPQGEGEGDVEGKADHDPSSSSEDSGSSRSASHGEKGLLKPAAKEKKPRPSVLEQAGLVGDCAREWAAKYGRPPTWGREVVKLNELAQAHGSDEVLRRWKNYLASVDGFYAGHPVTLFVANGQFDRFVGGHAAPSDDDGWAEVRAARLAAQARDTEVIDATPVVRQEVS